MIGSAFLVFLGILACHCYQELAKRNAFRHLYVKCAALLLTEEVVRMVVKLSVMEAQVQHCNHLQCLL